MKISTKNREEWLEARKSNINSTEIASLFGVSMPSAPTAFELYHIKQGTISGEIEDNAFMKWGRRLEDVIARGIAQDEGWTIEPLDDYEFDPVERIGSSFDYVINGEALLEIKTTTYGEFKKKFIVDDDGFIEAPEYYEFQCQHELEVADRFEKICLAVFILDTREYKLLWRDRDREFGQGIRNKVKWFWSLKQPPAIDLERDSDLFARLKRANNTDAEYNAMEDSEFMMNCIAYEQENAREKQSEKEKKILRSKLLIAMGDCNKAFADGYRISNKSRFTFTKISGK
jgi:putative phage-type endonuclease